MSDPAHGLGKRELLGGYHPHDLRACRSRLRRAGWRKADTLFRPNVPPTIATGGQPWRHGRRGRWEPATALPRHKRRWDGWVRRTRAAATSAPALTATHRPNAMSRSTPLRHQRHHVVGRVATTRANGTGFMYVVRQVQRPSSPQRAPIPRRLHPSSERPYTPFPPQTAPSRCPSGGLLAR
jgi:hypothetical protein